MTGEPLKYLMQSQLCNDENGEFSKDIFDLCLRKLSFPFSLTSSRTEMKNWTYLPPKVFSQFNTKPNIKINTILFYFFFCFLQKYFYSTLKGSSVTQEDYDDLVKLWDLKKFTHLLQMYEFYCSLGG